MQGCLRGEALSASVATECACCGRGVNLEIDTLGRVSVREADAAPLLFEPAIDWDRFDKAHIIDDF